MCQLEVRNVGYKLSVEVNFTNSDVSKLERYQAIQVHEVWVWEDGLLVVYHLQSGQYETVDRSGIPALADIDLTVLSECILMGETSRIQAGQMLLGAHPPSA